MADFIARHPFIGTEDKTIALPNVASYLVIYNDGSSEINVKAGQFMTVIKAGDAFDERLDPFDSITITGTGDYHGYVRVGGVK